MSRGGMLTFADIGGFFSLLDKKLGNDIIFMRVCEQNRYIRGGINDLPDQQFAADTGLCLGFAGRIILNEIGRKRKAGGIARFVIIPTLLTVCFVVPQTKKAEGK